MTLTWYGLSSFKITNVGNKVTLVTDPFPKETGLTPPRGGADLILISTENDLQNYTSSLSGDPLIIKSPGEFDVKGIQIRGINDDSGNENPATVYYLNVDDVRIGFLGALNSRELTEHQLEELGEVDILIVPVGGKEKVSNWEWASHIVQQVEPSWVVPSFFDQEGLKIDLESVDKFVKELGGESLKEDRLTLKPKDMSEENMKVVVLSPQR